MKRTRSARLRNSDELKTESHVKAKSMGQKKMKKSKKTVHFEVILFLIITFIEFNISLVYVV